MCNVCVTYVTAGQAMPRLEEAFTGHGVCINSGTGLDGLTTE